MASAAGALPTFLIIGAMKAGTTSLAQLLARHPDIGMSRQKELHFFKPEEPRGLDWYASQFAHVADRAARFEATPVYLYAEGAPGLIAAALPETVRFVAILRDPVDRAYSHYWHARRAGRPGVSFEEAVRIERELRARGGSGRFSFLDRGRYLPQLQRYAGQFGRERLLVVLFEDLVGDPAAVADEVAAFVGVERRGSAWGTAPHAHRARRAYVPTAVVRLFETAVAAPWLPRAFRRRVPLVLSLPFTPPPMDPRTRAELGRGFRGDNEALAAWLGRDLSHWTGMGRG